MADPKDPKDPKPAPAAGKSTAKAPKADKAKPTAGRVSEDVYSPMLVDPDGRLKG